MTLSRTAAQVGLTALSFLFGWQALRALLGLMSFLVRVRLGWDMPRLTALVVALFLSSLLALAARRRLGPRRLLAIAAGGLCLLRVALQLWTGDPVGEFVLAGGATMLFFFFLVTRLLDAHAEGPRGLAAFGAGTWLGLTLDTGLHGAFDTYDLTWRSGVTGMLLIAILGVAQWWLWTRDLGDEEAWKARAEGTKGSVSWIWTGFGAFLFLEALVFQNVARLTVLTGWSQPAAFAWIVAANALGLSCLLAALAKPDSRPIPMALSLGTVLVVNQWFPWPRGTFAALSLIGGQALSAILLAFILSAVARGRAGRGRLGLLHGVGMLGMLLLVFLYYSAYNIPLPFDNRILPPVAALAMAATAVGAARVLARRPGDSLALPGSRRLVAASCLLLLVPLYKAIVAGPKEAAFPGLPVKVMTYNLQFGFDPRGHLGAEAAARAIEEQDPDVVALQEVARGWFVTGWIDLVEWLANRLGMAYVFGPAADPLMGNAVLTRLPILGSEVRALPSEGLVTRRAFVSVRLDIGEERPLEVIATHFHHTRQGGPAREKQARAVVDFWQGRERTIFTGDLNGAPDSREIAIVRGAGLRDAFAMAPGFTAGSAAGFTWSSIEPIQRIDYIWVSPDLVATQVAVPPGQASDHLGVVATITSVVP